ncbi:MAG: TaqI-like C-terminal specificity domain-containing protein [Geobacteraceae bacterium]
MAISAAVDLKEQIRATLAAFAVQPLPQAARALFDTLGYNSPRDERVLKIVSPADFIAWVKSANLPNTLLEKEQQELTSSFKNLHFLFQLTDLEVVAVLGQGQADLFDSHTTVDGSRYESYLFFAAELSNDNPHSRTAMARLVRIINKPLPMPAMLLFRQGETVTLAVINRRLHKRDGSRDVLEKVTLIKDIVLSKPHRAHIEILHDLAVASLKKVQGITNFVSLHNAWRKVLDTSALNKRFYREITDWYFWAVKEVQFPLPPTNKLAKDPTNNSISVIRLLTRLIFTWFLKEKGLVPDCLFDEKELAKILVWANGVHPGATAESKAGACHAPLQGNDSTYYRAILQNLFFATLNAEMNRDVPGNRRFVQAEAGDFGKQKTEYGVKNIFRYADLFIISKDEAVRLFDDIPFLNGGLFDCLDKEDDNGKVIYLDGFTRNPKLQPVVPDYLFFSDYRTIDLSGDYGDKKRAQEKVRGLVSILRDYKFTVAENTPIEEEVALDPELLGNVFENLLASYNPETGVTARKLTGSFYTPRMIVNYMVDGALKAYLLQKLSDSLPRPQGEGRGEGGVDVNAGAGNAPLQDRLDTLIAWNDLPNPFSPEETAILIEAIHTLKTLDPAVGSGAFPMGLLHKMVHVLHKLDPDNARWKQAQLDAAYRMPDPAIRHDLIAHIEDAFDPSSNQADYGRKLFLIQNCIYGVDIQPIAVQIAKLRFFISLVVDQKVNDSKKNRGVLALPNLETRFVAANTLLGIDKPAMDNLFMFQIRAKEGELRAVRSRHFDARTRLEKLKCMADDKRIRKEIAELLEQDNYPHDKAVKLSDWNPYDQNVSAGFFDAEWMFGIADGFHICMGNPPYGATFSKEEKKLFQKQYLHQDYQLDSYLLFTERAFDLLLEGGVVAFILPNTWLQSVTYIKFRKYLSNSYNWLNILHLPNNIFDAVVDTMVIVFEKPGALSTKAQSVPIFVNDEQNVRLSHELEWNDIPKNGDSINIVADKNMQKLALKITSAVLLDDICQTTQGAKPFQVGKGKPPQTRETVDLKEFVSTEKRNETYRPLLRGSLINKFIILWDDNYWISFGDWLAEPRYSASYDASEKIVIRQTGDSLIATLDTDQFIVRDNLYTIVMKDRQHIELKYILGLLNSKLLNWYYQNIVNPEKGEALAQVKRNHLAQLPIPNVPPEKQAPIVALVERILAAKKSPPPPLSQRGEQTDIPALEAEIDRLVYALYGLTDEEIAVVEGKK